MALRILANIILLISVLFWPFWLSLLLGLGAMIYFPIFGEAVLLFFISDLLYGTQEMKFFGITYISLIVSTLVLLIIEYFKKKLRFYPNK